MAIGSTALVNLIIFLIIGAVIGLAFNRYARSWLVRLDRRHTAYDRRSALPERSFDSTSV